MDSPVPNARVNGTGQGPARRARSLLARVPNAVWATGLWFACASAGMAGLLVYSNAPGRAGTAPERWPSSGSLRLDPENPTLLMFAHPRCPCTRSSLHELDRLVAQVGERISSTVLFYRPAEAEEGWEHTDLWRLAEGIPGAIAMPDPDGEIAAAFGAETSGHVVVYDTSGRLVFSGGITAARAHEGDSRGRDSIRQLVSEGEALEPTAPVFGCPISEREGRP